MKASVYIGTSLDGFIAGLDGDIEWLVKFQNQEVIDSYEQFIRRIDAIVIGRGSFEKVLSFPSWPYDKKVFVLSSSIREVPEIVKDKVAILSMPPKELLKYFSKEGLPRLYIDGGKVIQDFLREDCIDEMIITRVPELIGKGIPLFGFLDQALLFRHVQTNIYSNGLVKSHYERVRK